MDANNSDDTFLIKKILQLIDKNNMTLNEIADELGLSRDELKFRLEMMEHMGEIESVKNNQSGCSGCSGSKCLGDNKLVVYQLTEKGRKICNK
ncbi:putative transcriptional regulator, AsnC family [Methanohalobium evestigatum Z-7303]|uniref:Putative transcriptional regulator, AsnC family n=1 Tax=Methanohalobium evestigatum (strain ATCC BAA-1072 / DSM 3721 / NBRC 107634 / OCM 161 / Z-7303) TaxID=644295 RepID=D7E7U3_METEZ|nr:FeoC-like transcriptional regulator [Methanohalobium evestigatum]ADI74166.1 putative transcriptional regulator, AsnC family [Methanohalobium evestigatum Z-7303]